MVKPPPRDPITGKAIMTPDKSIQDANAKSEKRKNFYASASSKNKVRFEMIELYDQIKKYNKNISRLIDYGLTETSINILFDAKYIKYNEEVDALFGGNNLTYSGVGEVPYLDPVEIERLIAVVLGRATTTTATQAVNDLLLRIRERREQIATETESLANNTSGFKEIGLSQAILQEFFIKIREILGAGSTIGREARGISFGTRPLREGQTVPDEISNQDIIDLIKYTDMTEPKRIEDMIVLLINICLQSKDNTILQQGIRKIRKESRGRNVYINIVTYILGSVDGKLLTVIYNTLLQFISNLDPDKTFFKDQLEVKDPSEREYKEPPEIPDITKKGSIENQVYALVNNTYFPNDEQRVILIEIIKALRTVPDITDDKFIENALKLFKIVMEEAYSRDNEPRQTLSETNRESSTYITSALNAFRSWFNAARSASPDPSTFLLAGGMLLNPSTALPIVRDILNNLKNKPVDITTVPDDQSVQPVLNTNTGPELTQQQIAQQFIDEYEDDENDVIDFSGQPGDYNEMTIRQRQAEIDAKRASGVLVDDDEEELKLGDVPLSERKVEEIVGLRIRLSNIFSMNNMVAQIEAIKALIKKIKENTSRPFKIIYEKLKELMNKIKRQIGRFSLVTRYVARVRVRGRGMIQNTLTSRVAAIEWITRQDTVDDNLDYDSLITPEFGIQREPTDDDGGGGGGGEPPDGLNVGARRRKPIFNGLSKKQYYLLLIVIILLSTGSISLNEIFKEGKKVKDDGTTEPPDKIPTDTPSTPDVPVIPDKPNKPDGTYNKIQHNEFWDSVGLSNIIDTYNGMVDKYNKLPKSEKNVYKSTIEKYYDKFAETVNIPTLKELKEARARYDALKKIYDNSDDLSFDEANKIYLELNKSLTYLNTMTDKYVSIENAAFGTSKTKDDPDVTIDDADANIKLPNASTTLGGMVGGKNKAIVDSTYAVLSKGMRERIARKLKGENDFSSGLIQEQKRFVDFSLVKPHEYPEGLGLDNPLVYRNKEYEIMKYRNNYSNPQPYIVPSRNRIEQMTKQYQPEFHDVIQLDDKLDDAYGFRNSKLENPNVYPSMFNKSRLFNPEYNLRDVNETKRVTNTMNDERRAGPYVGITDNQYYQYANIQQRQNEILNNYPQTKEFKIYKPELPKKTIKESRKVPNSYALK